MYALYEYMVEQGQRQGVMLQEYRNARVVQQVLIPENAPEIPGYVIRSVYKPYGEVGGDFFQIIPIGDGRRAGGDWRCEREGDAGGDDGVAAGGDAADAGALHAEPGGDVGGDEPAIDWDEAMGDLLRAWCCARIRMGR